MWLIRLEIISSVLLDFKFLYWSPAIQRVLYRAAISSFAPDLSGRRGRYALADGISAPFYCISLKNVWRGGYNAAARGLTKKNGNLILR